MACAVVPLVMSVTASDAVPGFRTIAPEVKTRNPFGVSTMPNVIRISG
jgi:hypothetical protein